MATIKVTTCNPPPPPPIVNVTIELSVEEARGLRTLLNRGVIPNTLIKLNLEDLAVKFHDCGFAYDIYLDNMFETFARLR